MANALQTYNVAFGLFVHVSDRDFSKRPKHEVFDAESKPVIAFIGTTNLQEVCMFDGKSEFELDLIEEKEDHLNLMVAAHYHVMEREARTGMDPQATICSLINMAKVLAEDYENIVGINYFENCTRDILAGGDGLHVSGE